MFESEVMNRILGPMTDEVTEARENGVTSFIMCTLHQILL
jgi:hypothetical protein